MNVTELEMAQATIEILGAVVCLVVAIIVSANGHKRKSMYLFRLLFLTNAVLLFSEACAYIFRGNVDFISLCMTRASNFITFSTEFLMLSLMIRYLYSLIEEKGGEPGKLYRNLVDGCVVFLIGILFVNIFTKWMYYFDKSNFYHRGFAWYIMTGFTIVCLLLSLIFSHKYSRYIGRSMLLTIWLYALVPVISIVIQIFVYGYSFTNLGIALSMILLLIVYLREWSQSAEDNDYLRESGRRNMYQIILFIIMVVCLSVSLIACIFTIVRISKENEESDNQTIAYSVSAGIENELLRPIVVTETITKDKQLLKAMKKDTENSDKNNRSDIPEIIDRYREAFDYSKVYAVCDSTMAFYTTKGYVKRLNAEADPDDIWYQRLILSGNEYDLYADTDKDNSWDLTLFVNRIVRSTNGAILGICGIGVDMDQVCDMIKEYEERYQIVIKLFDRNGILQMSSDKDAIRKEEMGFLVVPDESEYDFTAFTIGKKKSYVRYEKKLDLYLVIGDINRGRNQTWKIILPSMLIFCGGLVIMGLVFYFFLIRERKAADELKEKEKISRTDSMTGLWNRRAFDEDAQEMQRTGRLSDMTIVVIDMNGLKLANDHYGHIAGDEMLLGLVECMSDSFASYGKLYRCGGDEFYALLKCTPEELQDALHTFRYRMKNWRGAYVDYLSAAVGTVICEECPKKNITELLDLADKRMYENKQEYYRSKGTLMKV